MTARGLYPYRDVMPRLHGSVFVAPGARVVGDVWIGEGSGVWFNTVVRGDVGAVRIGAYTNIQDNATVHVADQCPAVVDDYVTVGHGAVIHGCHIHSCCLIGMGAILLNNSRIGTHCIIAAGTLIPENKDIPSHCLVMGVPGKVIREITSAEAEAIRQSALKYNEEAKKHCQ